VPFATPIACSVPR